MVRFNTHQTNLLVCGFWVLQAAPSTSEEVSNALHRIAGVLEEVTDEWEQRLEAVSELQVSCLWLQLTLL
jgi:hypothetical protein